MADLEPLDPGARALVDAYRAYTGPSPAVQARLRAAVLRDAAEPVPEVHPLARVRWLGPAVIVALAAAILAALSLRPATPQIADASGAAAPWELAPPAPAAAETRRPSSPRAEAPPPAAEPPPGVPPAAAPVRKPSLRTLSKDQDSKPKPDSPADDDGLAAELALIRPAQRALAEGRPGDALAGLAAHAARFPAGLLREEYLALHAVALCQAGRASEGRDEARAFLRAHAASMLAGRVRAACGDDAATDPAATPASNPGG